MFEVKGWKVSAPLKADTSVAAKESLSSNDKQQTSTSHKTSKKRKRAHPKSNGFDVTAENLADVWKEHIEGKPAKKQRGDEAKAQDAIQHGKKATHTTKAVSTLRSNGVSDSDERVSKHKKRAGHKKTDADASEISPAGKIPASKSAATILSQALEPSTITSVPSKLTPMQSKMSHKLASARFRHLNEQLYTTPSAESLSLFSSNPDMFADYHAGFAQQVEVWPENPIDSYIADITARGRVRGPPGGKARKGEGPREVKPGELEPLPRIRDRNFQCVISDLGCGTAKIASSLKPQLKKLNLKISSFDLHAPNSLVTAADIAHLPLEDSSVDVAIACLALMGTNWIDFVEEAWRTLRWRGELWVAEIKSRFSRALSNPGSGTTTSISKRQQKKQGLVGKSGAKKDKARQEKENKEQLAVEVDGVRDGVKGGTDVAQFVKVLERRGFSLEGEPDLGNRMFVKLRFVKAALPTRGKHVKQGGDKGKKFVEKLEEDTFEESDVLKPCVYKLR